MFAFIVGIILILVAIGLVLYRRDNYRQVVAGSKRKQVRFFGWGAAIAAALGLVLVVLACVFTVPTKEEAILTSFGTTSGHYGSGIHVKRPWEKVHDMDAAIQTDTWEDKKSDGTCQAIAVRIAFQQTGCSSVSIQWRIQPSSAEELYKDFRSFGHVRDALVTRKLTQALNVAFADYNPLNIAEARIAPEDTLPEISNRVKTDLSARVGKQIERESHLRLEAVMGLDSVARYAVDGATEPGKLRVQVAKLLAFRGAAGRVVFRVKVED